MKAVVFVLLAFVARCAEPSPTCPIETSHCYCSSRPGGPTFVVCSDIQNTSHLEQATKPLKSLIIDRLVLLNLFPDYSDAVNVTENEIEPKGKPPTAPTNGVLPKKWLSELRVRDVEIQSAKLNGFLFTDDAFEGQSEFLISVVVKNSNLRGHLCASCSPGYSSVSTKSLRKTPLIQYIDFSGNQLEVLDGSVFPPNLRELRRIDLSGNRITRVHDNAFASLHKLNYLDLSRNRLAAVSRKFFRMPADTSVAYLDLSYNAILSLPEEMFQGMNGLREVRLNHNLLETLPSNTWIKVPSLLERIDVTGNFLVCNCTMSWISRRLSKNTKLFGHCIAPENVEFEELKPNLNSLNSC